MIVTEDPMSVRGQVVRYTTSKSYTVLTVHQRLRKVL